MGTLRIYLKTLIFTILVPGTLAVAIPQVLARWRPLPELPVRDRPASIAGTISLIAGMALYLHTVIQFGSEGDGTPSPTDEPDELVTGGIYAYSRNPMYIGVLLVIIGQALRQRSVSVCWWAAGMWIGFHNRVIGFEEPHLMEKHGEEYEQYCEEVPRWFR